MAGKKTANTAYIDLRRAIREGEPGNLYVFHGEEKYLMEESLAALREKLETAYRNIPER